MSSATYVISILLKVVVISNRIIGNRALVINKLEVPSIVRNDTGPFDLSCTYELNDSENGLIVKWYHDSNQIYQWIPPLPPQDVGIIKGLTEYSVENLKRPDTHSIIRLKKITLNMSGEYKCAISTFLNEDTKAARMIVYVPERKLTIDVTPFNESHVNLACAATEAQPRPILKLYVEGVKVIDNPNSVHSYADWYDKNPVVTHNTIVKKFVHAVVIECEISIPETDYKRREKIVYYPNSRYLHSLNN